MRRIMLFGLALTMMLGACRKNIDDTEWMDDTPNPDVVEIINGTVLGIVSNENGDPVEDVVIRLGQQQTMTDEFGAFLLKDAALDSDGAYLTATKEGYFAGSRTFIPLENLTSQVRITLLERNVIGSFESGLGGEVNTPDGASISFQADGIVTANGTAYSGEVQVAAKWLDPTDPEIGNQMPGDLRAIDADNDEVVLTSFGMLAVELQDPSGNELALAEGKPATLSFPLPPEILAVAPESIPLWYFDEELGIWIEDGSAQLIGESYVGEVTHFTFWNSDLPGEPIAITGQIVSQDGNGLAGIHVGFTMDGVAGTSHGYTMEDGYFVGSIPADQVLTMIVWDPCGEVVYEEEVGPFADLTDLGQVTIATPDLTTVSGQLVDCNGSPVSFGYVVIELSGNILVEVEDDGSFSLDLVYCNQTELSITGVDAGTLQSGDATVFALEPIVDAGVITACGNLLAPPYISLLVNGEEYFWSIDSLVGGGITAISEGSLVDGNSYGLSSPSTRFVASMEDWVNSDFISIELVFPAQGTATGLQEGYLEMAGNDPVDGDYEFNGVYSFTDLNIFEYGANSFDPIRGYFEVTIPSDGIGVPVDLNIICNFAILRE